MVENVDGDSYADLVELFPDYCDWLESAAFALLYRQHGGSGLGLLHSDILEMELPEIERWLERLRETRAEEAKQLGPRA